MTDGIGSLMSAPILWREEYSVGVADIDAQHKRLLELLNRWWINHILETDQQLGRELNRQGVR